MADIAPELVERMANHLRYCIADIPDRPRHDARSQALWDELKAITDLLPTPVDPDLIEARQVCSDALSALETEASEHWSRKVLSGDYDTEVRAGIPIALAAIKRGRELAREEGK